MSRRRTSEMLLLLHLLTMVNFIIFHGVYLRLTPILHPMKVCGVPKNIQGSIFPCFMLWNKIMIKKTLLYKRNDNRFKYFI